MYKDTFNRKEVKYHLAQDQASGLQAVISDHLPLGEFGCGAVNTVYLDTPGRSVIARSLEKPLYKEKVRVRWYGACSLEEAEAAFIELKKKFKGVVYKRRLQASPTQAQAFLGGASCAELRLRADERGQGQQLQIAREIDQARKRAGHMVPSVLISCERTSFGSDGEGDVRITFDERLHAFGLFEGEGAVGLLGPNQAIMEVKCLGAYPSWLVQGLSGVKGYPSSFSKYGAFYQIARRQAASPQSARVQLASTSVDHVSINRGQAVPLGAASVRNPPEQTVFVLAGSRRRSESRRREARYA